MPTELKRIKAEQRAKQRIDKSQRGAKYKN
jgi:hypothetical protein